MSAAGNPGVVTEDFSGRTVTIVAASWHQETMAALIASATRVCKAAGANVELIRVPGSFELPIVALEAAKQGANAVVALGVVERGETPHFDYVCSAATQGLTQAALKSGVPMGFGVIMADNAQQVFDRSGLPGSKEDKGAEAAAAAINTALELEKMRDRFGFRL